MMADDDAEVQTRDLGTLGEDGPQLTQFESPVARRTAAETVTQQRPSYSPVAQPGMTEEIWFHTVESDRQARAQNRQPTRGMIGRLHGPRQEVIIEDGGGRRRRRGRG